MKVPLLIIILLFSIYSFGQTTSGKQATVTKGYYSIGTNYLKLGTDSTSSTGDTMIIPVISKGYFAIKNKNLWQASKVSTAKKKVSRPAIPVITKGYYAIGNNAQKLIQK